MLPSKIKFAITLIAVIGLAWRSPSLSLAESGDPTGKPISHALDCDLSYKRDYGFEGLCLYAEKSALAGVLPRNPIAIDAIENHIKLHRHTVSGEEGSLMIDLGKIWKYLEPRVKRIHDCYAQKKVNICDIYHTN